MRQMVVLLLILLLPGLISAQTPETPPARPVVFTHVTVIDVTGALSRSDRTVIVTGNRIAAVGRTGKVRIPKNAQIVDAAGKFLIPGLWDMHIHSFTDNGQEWLFPLLIANGVTGVREMGNRLPFEQINQIRREILEGKILGPRYGAVTARILDGPGSQIPPSTVVETAEQARSLVRDYKQHGMDFIKPYNLLSREVYLAIIDEAKRQKIPVAGHVPLSMTAAEASELGQILIDHNSDVMISCSRDEKTFRQELLTSVRSSQPRPIGPMTIKAAATYDEQKAVDLFARFVRNGTWITPTLVITGSVPAERRRPGDSRMKYIPAPTQEYWRNGYNGSIRVLPNADDRKIRDKKILEMVGSEHRAGVRLLAGTDAPNPYVFPGFSLHDELELLVQAGLSPLEALQTATINPARFLGKEKELGMIEKGKLGDLVLLEANPLESISNTRRINAVVVNGRYLPQEALQKLLTQVESGANGGKSH